MDKYSDIPIIEIPDNIKVTLFRHQLAAIYALEKREKEKIIQNQNDVEIIDTNVGIYSDMTGYGKTAALIVLILRDKMKWNMRQKYEHKYITAVYGNGRIMRTYKEYYERLNCNLIIASQSLIKQWKDEFEKIYNIITIQNHREYDLHKKEQNQKDILRLCIITTRKMSELVDPKKFDVIIISPTMYNKFVSRFMKYVWKRFIFDEPCHTTIGSMKSILCGFSWFVTATPNLLLSNTHNSYHFLKSLFSSHLQYSIFYSLIIKNPDQFVKLSYSIKKPEEIYHICIQIVFNTVRGLISDNISEMISAGNIEGAVRSLGGNNTDNILELVKNKKQEELDEVTMKIDLYSRNAERNAERITLLSKKKLTLEKQLTELNSRFEDALKNPCNICLSNLNKPVMLTCCQNIFCGECIFAWVNHKNTCPLCRFNVTPENIAYISKDKNSEEKLEKTDNPMTKTKTIVDLIKNKENSKFIIFSSYNETFSLIRTTLQNENIKFKEIRGHTNTREKNIDAFKKGEISVIFLNSRNNGAGINLQEATDIILYHEMADGLKQQIIGRANRIGRKTKLTIHHLV